VKGRPAGAGRPCKHPKHAGTRYPDGDQIKRMTAELIALREQIQDKRELQAEELT
jgi:hypothetical protein